MKNMLSQKILRSLKKNNHIKDFFKNNLDFEVQLKRINKNELKRLDQEHPTLFDVNFETIKNLYESNQDRKNNGPLLSVTFIKNDFSISNYKNLKKIKVYIDEISGKIIKILRN